MKQIGEAKKSEISKNIDLFSFFFEKKHFGWRSWKKCFKLKNTKAQFEVILIPSKDIFTFSMTILENEGSNLKNKNIFQLVGEVIIILKVKIIVFVQNHNHNMTNMST